MTATIALLGNPNAGKTTLFNQLTGARQRVGNWPGVTVEQKTGELQCGEHATTLVDLPGTYSLYPQGEDSLDQLLAQQFMTNSPPDVVLNIIDASSLERGLYLFSQLQEVGVPIVVALNMTDVAKRDGVTVDSKVLSEHLGCPVVPLVASRNQGVDEVRAQLTAVLSADDRNAPAQSNTDQPSQQVDQDADINRRYDWVAQVSQAAVTNSPPAKPSITDRIDAVVLNRWLAFPIFLGAMYLMFMFTINFGGAFIDVFDGVAGVLFVEGPRQLLESIGLPAGLVALIADGLGGGIQLVASFIPIIGGLFLFQSYLEASGYMARAAFIVDRGMRSIGLPGKSFVPLIVGFGCNVPSVMAARTLDRQGDRLLTVLMAPFMSCGARLTVYVLFASVFFTKGAQNVIFALYLIGILLAVLSGLAVRKQALGQDISTFVMELPNYHWPNLKGVLISSWQRLKGFIVRAGKAIVAVVVVLNVVNSLGTDGSFGNQDTEQSMLSHIGKQLTPAFEPIGVSEDNWPATVGIFTGIFAKEVVVGTLDALYGAMAREENLANEPEQEPGLLEQLGAAFQTVPDNLSELGGQWSDPLGVSVGDLSDTAEAAESQGVEVSTLSIMSRLFDGPAAAFAYLLFVLLYMPCVATIGAIFKEIGAFWAIFSATWNTVLAYAVAVWCYQGATFADHPGSSAAWILAMLLVLTCVWLVLIYFARKEVADSRLISVVNIQ